MISEFLNHAFHNLAPKLILTGFSLMVIALLGLRLVMNAEQRIQDRVWRLAIALAVVALAVIVWGLSIGARGY